MSPRIVGRLEMAVATLVILTIAFTAVVYKGWQAALLLPVSAAADLLGYSVTLPAYPSIGWSIVYGGLIALTLSALGLVASLPSLFIQPGDPID